MATRIGDTIRPELGAIDFTNLARLNYETPVRTGAALATGIAAIGSAIAERREQESNVKARQKMLEEASKMFPGSDYLSGLSEALADKSVSFQEKRALSEQLGPLLDLGIAAYERDRDYGLRERAVKTDERRLDLEGRRIGIAESQALAEIAGAEVTKEEANAKALSDTISVVQPLEDMLAKVGAKDDSDARRRIDKLISEGRGAEALDAAKEWAKNARSEINRTMGSGGFKLDRIGVTLADGSPGEMDVLVGPDGMVLDLQGNRVSVPPRSGLPAAVERFVSPSPGDDPTPDLSRFGIQGKVTTEPPLELFNGYSAGSEEVSPSSHREPASLARFLRNDPNDLSRVPFGAAPSAAPYDGQVLPPKPPTPGNRTTPPPRFGIRPLVSPKETPAEALAKSRMQAGDSRLTETLKQAETLGGNLPNLRQTKALLDEVRTGFGAEAITQAKRVLGRDVSNAEQLQTLLGDQVMARVAQTKGAVSEKEMDLFQQFSANFGKTNDGNRKIVDFAIKAAERAQRIRQAITDGFRSGRSPYEIEQEVLSIQQSEPIADILVPPAPAPGGIPVDEDEENQFFNTKPRTSR